jgi:hypothetical protein
LPNHDFAYRLRTQERPSQVSFDYFIPILKPHFLDGSAPGYSRIIDEDINPSEFLNGRIHKLLNARRALNIASQGNRLYTELLQFLGGLAAALFLSGTQHHERTHLPKALRHLPPKSNRPTGDDRDATRKIEKLLCAH